MLINDNVSIFSEWFGRENNIKRSIREPIFWFRNLKQKKIAHVFILTGDPIKNI